jgi:hypothetical protein
LKILLSISSSKSCKMSASPGPCKASAGAFVSNTLVASVVMRVEMEL